VNSRAALQQGLKRAAALRRARCAETHVGVDDDVELRVRARERERDGNCSAQHF
jgi:hypothetical protein